YLAKAVLSRASRGDKIAVLGLSYKPGTDVIEQSPAVSLVRSLIARKHKVILHDPASLETARKHFKNKVTYRENFRVCVREADVVVIATPWEDYKKIKDADLRRNGRSGKTIIDCWRMFDERKFPAHVIRVPFGVSLIPLS
ncbi:MAG: UDP binding domain-containing protein, partial [Candidatus Omnitrophota bacterium]